MVNPTEMRFWVFLPFVPFQIAGAWWFGYALQLGQPWAAVAVAWAMANFGQAPISAIALTYLTDSYNEVRWTKCPPGCFRPSWMSPNPP